MPSRRNDFRQPLRLILAAVLMALGSGATSGGEDAGTLTNSIGMTMVRIEPGSFRMGALSPVDAEAMGVPALLAHDAWDETPVRRVTISHPFFISETEVTVEQFRQFRPDSLAMGSDDPFLSGISWEDAVDFTEWLSQKEGKPYRLPTEAEWEYVARAGTETPFSSGNRLPRPGQANRWGIRNMHTGVAEWCLDWHGRYPDNDEVDPVGPDGGVARVFRGGGIGSPFHRDTADAPYYRRSANRAGMIPSFSGQHPIGFRVVQAPLPDTAPTPARRLFIQEAVVQDPSLSSRGPDPDEPFFARQEMMPIPPENMPQAATVAAGFHPGLGAHNHSPGLVVCSNGDLLVIYFSASANFAESWNNTDMVATRLRFGSEEWDLPELFYDLPDVNDETALLWNDGGRIWLFTGGDGLWRAPFRLSHSTDNGATWSPMRLPFLVGPVGGYHAQPINSAFRDADGVVYVGTDALGGSSVLWASRDDGTTWSDTGGRTGGRHTTFAVLKDGRILGMGGKSTNIDGYMPKSISEDSGRSWTVSKTPFASLGGNQRPTLIRLASGRLFFAGDFQRNSNGYQPEGITQKGAYVALSDDEGETWHIKRLPGAAPHESSVLGRGGAHGNIRHDEDTLGYSVARQAPNGLIHLIATMNHPNLHFEMNEAWILDPEAGLMAHEANPVRELRHEELYPDGSLKGSWGGRVLDDGRFVLDGDQAWYWENGNRQYAVTYRLGRKTGEETHWTEGGVRDWTRDHAEDGSSIWRRWWPNGQKRTESHWKDNRCVGTATHWDRDGEVVGRWEFKDGALQGPEGEFILSDLK